MSLSFLSPPVVAQSRPASTVPKVHGQVKPQFSLAVAGSTAAGSVAAVTLAAAVAQHHSRGPQRRGTCINISAFENELGVQAPVGFWDPAGLTKDGDAETFTRRRATEIKHGRVAMIACIGYIVPEFFRWPGFCSPSMQLPFTQIPNGLKALDAVPGAGWFQMILFALALEKGVFVHDPARAPGDFANGGVLGVPNKSSMPPGEERNRRLSAELANGRLAMMAIIGMFYQDGLTGSAWGDWEYYTDSPLRAFENELGVQDPVGFWDPLNFALDGDVTVFRRRRESEIKHGRISMIACIGYIVPQLGSGFDGSGGIRFDGVLSPSQPLFFSQIPHGLKAFSALPSLGIAQFVLFCGVIETGFFRQDPARAPGDFKNGGILGVPNASGPLPDAEERKRKLNAELANGRLAMMAIIGMFFQDGLTGSPWGDWANYVGSPLRALESEDVQIATNTGFIDMTQQYGVCAPAGKPGIKIWDPAGLAKNIDSDTFRQYRAAELKHGRICMVALIGLLVQHWWILPRFIGHPKGIGAAMTGEQSGAALALVLMIAGIIEFNSTDEGREPGDFGDPFDLIPLADFDPQQPEEKALWKNRELNHGRLAMVGFLGSVMAEYATGLDAVDQWGLAGRAWNRTLTILSFPDSPVAPLDQFV